MFIADIPSTCIFLKTIQRIFSFSPLCSQYKGWVKRRLFTCIKGFIKKPLCSPRTHQSIVVITKCPWKFIKKNPKGKAVADEFSPKKPKKCRRRDFSPEVETVWNVGKCDSSAKEKAKEIEEKKRKMVRREKNRDLRLNIVTIKVAFFWDFSDLYESVNWVIKEQKSFIFDFLLLQVLQSSSKKDFFFLFMAETWESVM